MSHKIQSNLKDNHDTYSSLDGKDQLTANLRKNKKDSDNKSTLVLSTKHGNIKIKLRPDLSQGSVKYIYELVQSKHCDKCNFYRAENPAMQRTS